MSFSLSYTLKEHMRVHTGDLITVQIVANRSYHLGSWSVFLMFTKKSPRALKLKTKLQILSIITEHVFVATVRYQNSEKMSFVWIYNRGCIWKIGPRKAFHFFLSFPKLWDLRRLWSMCFCLSKTLIDHLCVHNDTNFTVQCFFFLRFLSSVRGTFKERVQLG